MKYDRLSDELQIATQLAFSQSIAENTSNSICANTTLKSSTKTKADFWLHARQIPSRNHSIGANETLNLINLASAISSQNPIRQGDLPELRALVSQIRQLQKMRQQLGPIDSQLGRTWQSAIQCERAALMAQERLKLACSSEAPKEPVAEALIIYLTQLRNNLDS